MRWMCVGDAVQCSIASDREIAASERNKVTRSSLIVVVREGVHKVTRSSLIVVAREGVH